MIWINRKYILFHHILHWVNPYHLACKLHYKLPLQCYCIIFYLPLALPWYIFTIRLHNGKMAYSVLTKKKTYSYLQLNANMPEIQHMHISLPFSKFSSGYCQACFPWVPWSSSPLISIALSLVRMASSCLSPCVEACIIFFMALYLE